MFSDDTNDALTHFENGLMKIIHFCKFVKKKSVEFVTFLKLGIRVNPNLETLDLS